MARCASLTLCPALHSSSKQTFSLREGQRHPIVLPLVSQSDLQGLDHLLFRDVPLTLKAKGLRDDNPSKELPALGSLIISLFPLCDAGAPASLATWLLRSPVKFTKLVWSQAESTARTKTPSGQRLLLGSIAMNPKAILLQRCGSHGLLAVALAVALGPSWLRSLDSPRHFGRIRCGEPVGAAARVRHRGSALLPGHVIKDHHLTSTRKKTSVDFYKQSKFT